MSLHNDGVKETTKKDMLWSFLAWTWFHAFPLTYWMNYLPMCSGQSWFCFVIFTSILFLRTWWRFEGIDFFFFCLLLKLVFIVGLNWATKWSEGSSGHCSDPLSEGRWKVLVGEMFENSEKVGVFNTYNHL